MRRQCLWLTIVLLALPAGPARAEVPWEQGFQNPPPDCRPEVFWDWMGGLLSKEGITKDLEALAREGVGGVLIMQMPDQLACTTQWRFRDYPGKVKCLSDEWFAIMNHTAKETDRLGLRMSFVMCPGWSHCGGPWIKAEQSLKILVASRTPVTGGRRFDSVLPRAPIHQPKVSDETLAGNAEADFWDRVRNPREDFYRDVAVVALPAATNGKREAVPLEGIIDLTKRMDAKGRLVWDAPPGEWTVVRLGVASDNGPNHPAPPEAMGLECDRMDAAAVRTVFHGMIGRILKEARAKGYKSVYGFDTDSYEAGRQDFCLDFRSEFRKRRGYDCTPWLPAWLDPKLVIGDGDLTKRFRTDMLQTVSDLGTERFYGELRRLADENQLQWMIEPYFLMNHDWRTAGARAHVPGCEFWMSGQQLVGPAPDIAALYGHKIVWAEAFTSESYDSAWRNDPWRMKPIGDAAFCLGINHFVMHGFTHNPFDDRYQPGLTMGFWGTQMNRHVTWWPFAAPWHRYLARCHYLLRQGLPVADVLTYPPRAEHIPGPVLNTGSYKQTVVNDEALLGRLAVRNGRIVLPHGTSYAALALVPGEALRPAALKKIRDLVDAGATLIGSRPPARSPSLEDYPACDQEVAGLIDELWGQSAVAAPSSRGGSTLKRELQQEQPDRQAGKGRVLIRPVIEALDDVAGGPDFTCRPFLIHFFARQPEGGPNVHFCHRHSAGTDAYFLTNQEDQPLKITADFRIAGKQPELWDPVTGTIRPLPDFVSFGPRTLVPLELEPRQSHFVVFREPPAGAPAGSKGRIIKKGVSGKEPASEPNFPSARQVMQLTGPWDVSFDPKWGGPEHVTFDALADWTQRAEPGIQYYSGAATYRKKFDLPRVAASAADATRSAPIALDLDLGTVKNLARVRLNGRDLGIVWCAPWRVPITAAVNPSGNQLEITVVNLWVNRMIGDEQESEDCELVLYNPPERKGGYRIDVPGRGLKDLPDWLILGMPRPSARRFTFTSWRYYPKDAPLMPSGLLGPVRVLETPSVSTP